MQLTARSPVLWLVASLAACTASSSVTEMPVPVAPPGIAPGGGGFAGPGADPEPRCPAARPTVGTTCTDPSVNCAYGADVREECNEIYTCGPGNRWVRHASDCASDCPATFDGIVQGSACADDGRIACSYDEGTCGCVSPPQDLDAGGDGGPALRSGTWKCVPPPTGTYCPSARPNHSVACVRPAQCDYGTCALGRPLEYECGTGYWGGPSMATCEAP